ncbi:MAG: hypothetical protein FWC11_03645 [Firmicutes bacterium]|nr:hypothetical protein [Bacillota bacterium]MCL2255934.1 hypothetical protein [Bacillota bacterium]
MNTRLRASVQVDCYNFIETDSLEKFLEHAEEDSVINVAFQLNSTFGGVENVLLCDYMTQFEVDKLWEANLERGRAYHSRLNRKFLRENNIDLNSEYYDVFVCEFTPFVIKSFENVSYFKIFEERIVEIQCTNDIYAIYVSKEVELELQQSRIRREGETLLNHSWSNVLRVVGQGTTPILNTHPIFELRSNVNGVTRILSNNSTNIQVASFFSSGGTYTFSIRQTSITESVDFGRIAFSVFYY